MTAVTAEARAKVPKKKPIKSAPIVKMVRVNIVKLPFVEVQKIAPNLCIDSGDQRVQMGVG